MCFRSPRQGKTALSKLPLVAIIDDDASVRATTDSLVRSLGYIVYTFASAEEFLRSHRVNDLSCDCRCPNARHERRRVASLLAYPGVPRAVHFLHGLPR